MNAEQIKTVKAEVENLIQKSGLILSQNEWAQLTVNDFGLGDFYKEGFTFIDLLRSPQIRVCLLVLLPNQTLPQHVHTPYEGEAEGKEETLRVLYGHTKVYIEGQIETDVKIPEGKDAYYTALKEIPLNAGGQFSIPPQVKHWFKAGPEGSVNMTFQKRVDESKNIFDDPNSTGCPIKLTD